MFNIRIFLTGLNGVVLSKRFESFDTYLLGKEDFLEKLFNES